MVRPDFLYVLLVVGFVGASSCGSDNSSNLNRDLEMQAMRNATLMKNNNKVVTVTSSVVATAIVNQTNTVVQTFTSSSSSTSTGGSNRM